VKVRTENYGHTGKIRSPGPESDVGVSAQSSRASVHSNRVYRKGRDVRCW